MIHTQPLSNSCRPHGNELALGLLAFCPQEPGHVS